MGGHVLELRGCTPEPLGNYLKGLGVFRLIAEQADPQARAWWKDGFLHVVQDKWVDSESASAENGCVDWLLNECRFTPLIAPWQKNTGYLPTGSREKGGKALLELLTSDHIGTESFRSVFRDFAAGVGVSLPDDKSKWLDSMKPVGEDRSKAELLRILRNRLQTSSSLRWLDAVGLSSSRSRDADIPRWFAILASGGGEASGQYIVNHQQRLKSVLLDDQEQSRRRLEGSLAGKSEPGTLEGKSMGAMYYPSLMKVPNAGQHFLPDPQVRVNPWDFILLLEGCLVWSMAATRRKGVTSERASFPFFCRSSFGGSTMIGPKEVEGSENSIAKGELWCPTWDAPATLSELQRIFGEGRIQVGEKICTRSLDFALAMTGLGTDRGIQAFHRYSLLERSGSGRQTTLLAVPSSCFVPQQATDIALLTDLRDFAESIATNLTDNGQQPRRLMLARIDFERAWFAATTSSIASNRNRSESLSDLIVATGRLSRELGTHSAEPGVVKIKRGEKTSEKIINPVGDLRRNWAKVVGKTDQSSEYRLARAIAEITAWGEASSDGRPAPAVESLRANLLPVARRWNNEWAWDDTTRSAVWARGASLEVNFAAVLRRRLIDAQHGTGDGLPFWSRCGARFSDLLAFWNRDVDEARLADLIHGMALINFWNWESGPRRQERIDTWQQGVPERAETPDIDTSGMWFDEYDIPQGKLRLPFWLRPDEFNAACELPRVYHLLKLCFVGGRLPHRPLTRRTVARTGDEPFASKGMDILALLQAGRPEEAVQLAAHRLRAKGYPTIVCDPLLERNRDHASMRHSGMIDDHCMSPEQCRRLAGMLLIPVRQPGVCAALAIKPKTTN